MIASENVETHISGKFSILFVVSDGLNKAGSEISVFSNTVTVFFVCSISYSPLDSIKSDRYSYLFLRSFKDISSRAADCILLWHRSGYHLRSHSRNNNGSDSQGISRSLVHRGKIINFSDENFSWTDLPYILPPIGQTGKS